MGSTDETHLYIVKETEREGITLSTFTAVLVFLNFCGCHVSIYP